LRIFGCLSSAGEIFFSVGAQSRVVAISNLSTGYCPEPSSWPSTTELLSQVITQLEADGTDSDGDGQGDVAELRAGTNPNDTGSTPLRCYTPPPAEGEGGCAVRTTTRPAGLPLAAALLIAAMMLRRRARVQR
jgi:hypothetical protein